MAIGTALTIAAIGASAASTAMSFADANKQKKLQRQAEVEAKNAMAEARKKLDVNYYDELAIQKEPYELQREALLSAGAQAIQAGVEGESRGAGATVGRVMMAQNEAQAGQRTAMGADQNRLAELSAAEESRLRDALVYFDAEEAAGAQLAAKDAQEARAAAIAQGMQGIQNVAQMGIQAMELYPGTKKTDTSASDKKVKPDAAGGMTGPVLLTPESTVEDATRLYKDGFLSRKEYEDFIYKDFTNNRAKYDFNSNPFEFK